MEWYGRLPARWQIEQEIARRFMEDVEAGFDAAGLAFTRGTYSLRLNCGHELARFKLRIVYPPEFLTRGCHPHVYLDSHHDQWENEGDTHIEDTWKLCLYVPLESGLDFFREDATAGLFTYIHTFLIKQRLFQQELKRARSMQAPAAEWPGPERTHGPAGLYEAIKESGRKLGRNDPCACGSGKKFKKCCFPRVEIAKRKLASPARRK
jgi:hypothetical protein